MYILVIEKDYTIKVLCKGNIKSTNLDGVGPADNRPSTDYLYHFVQKKKKEKEKQ